MKTFVFPVVTRHRSDGLFLTLLVAGNQTQGRVILIVPAMFWSMEWHCWEVPSKALLHKTATLNMNQEEVDGLFDFLRLNWTEVVAP